MGFFNFRKQEKQELANNTQEKEQETIPEVQTPVQPPLQKEILKPDIPFISNSKKKKEKDDINGFFSIDIYNIFKHNPELTEKHASIDGKTAEAYTLKLPNLELSTFFKVEIFKFEDGHYDLFFLSNVNEIRDDLKEFCTFCATSLGPDFMNKGSINDKDYRDAALGVFSRIWSNKVTIDNLYFTICLRLSNITPQ
ncbi:hypothetical protein M2459_001803 [Parabacteroides sp. PF5-5]|uniref:hypothetical protein n=1 Tax=unclassified Parabacteroides TaxID=2649774 RepID=UPI002475CDD6|nr:MULTISPECIES: hypothetical protein [unclassified Parabacteroides]MDH6305066.1 hypothetical protein [Parabacteroides sp. PH5-39]MDH6315849.1 hypothetical protein [Parabacteroides sp. PF5-13]MDH6319506.1 hypothetical protein [Parabacteroides sp. PH5-13]MDH6323237.1 hypothetical protein [Parabacteroides sp. PH5-8]MDH6327255.1 hypothetical protein [Parabacteroides sp. PH5-41]